MVFSVFSAAKVAAASPTVWYQRALAGQGFVPDAAQARAIARLQILFDELLAFKAKRSLFLRRYVLSPDPPRGVYLWGGVGRGKSLLMDAFFACLPYRRKRRVHFHHFMQEVHQELRTLKQREDPLAVVAERIAKKTRLLCFDEFHVSDIADAMILGRLLEFLFAEGVVLVLTSNYPPAGLYPDGLQREKFLPTIALLDAKLDVLEVDGGQDYRLRRLERLHTYHTPLGANAHAALEEAFSRLATAPPLRGDIEIAGRRFKPVRHAPGVIWFDFKELCGLPRAQADYLELARDYPTVLLANMPQLKPDHASEARRFTWLIDVFYDQRVKLIVSAAVPVELLYVQGPFAAEFSRTVSRLQEMQSGEYLSLPHRG
jgi:cell division protein ZapE